MIKKIDRFGITCLVTFVVDIYGSTYFLDVDRMDKLDENSVVDVIRRKMNLCSSYFNIAAHSVVCNENFALDGSSNSRFNEVFLKNFENKAEKFSMFSYTSLWHVVNSWIQSLFNDENEDYKKTAENVRVVMEFFKKSEWEDELQKSGMKLFISNDLSLKYLEFDSFLENYTRLRQLYAGCDGEFERLRDSNVSVMLHNKEIHDKVKIQLSSLKILKSFLDEMENGISLATAFELFFKLEINDFIPEHLSNKLFSINARFAYYLDPKLKGARMEPKEKSDLRIYLIMPLMRTKKISNNSELDYLGFFLKGEGFFKNPDLNLLVDDPVNYWKCCEEICPNLSKFALQHSNLPSSIEPRHEVAAEDILSNMSNNEALDDLTTKIFHRCYYLLQNSEQK